MDPVLNDKLDNANADDDEFVINDEAIDIGNVEDYDDNDNDDGESDNEGDDEDNGEDIVTTKKQLSISQRPKLVTSKQNVSKTDKPYSKKYTKFEGNPQDQLYLISEKMLTMTPGHNSDFEMEAKFGTKGIKRITKIDYDNVIKKLKSIGFKSDNESGDYSLKIQPETMYRGELSVSGNFDLFRVEINGILNIQEYCKTNNIKSLSQKSPGSVIVLQKYDVKETSESDNYIHSADFDDFNFRVTMKTERTFNKNNPKVMNLFDSWNNKKKIFRYINRVTYKNSLLFPAFKVDLSIVRSSSKNGYKMSQTTNISESNVFNNQETYEIEVELINNEAMRKYIRIVENNQVIDNRQLANDLQKIVRYILSGLQGTDYPVKYSEQNQVIENYLKTLFEKEYKEKGETYQPKRVNNSNFIGPSSVALQRINIIQTQENDIVPNITKPYSYCVTDKADGERHLLYIDVTGKIYLINTNMNVIFTGAKTEYEKAYNTIIDGELITHNKYGNFINKYAAFDIYYIGGVDTRHYPFMYTPKLNVNTNRRETNPRYRLNLLQQVIKKLNPIHINFKKENENKTSSSFKLATPISIVAKAFYPFYKESSSETKETKETNEQQFQYNIYESCQRILNDIGTGIIYDYEVDGLIFTPTSYGVGSNTENSAGPKKKITWNYSFKWKPSEPSTIFSHSYNTIDFLVKTVKNENSMDIITPIFENGVNMYDATNLKQYKMLQLCVGYSLRDHGYLNPCNDLLEDKFHKLKDNESDDPVENEYSAKQFYPSDPYDLSAGLANIMLKLDGNNSYQMFTEEGETFTDDMIVEFKYDKYSDKSSTSWKWIPLRIRYDKTADYRLTNRNFGNNYNVANSTWYSIHNPITEEMISTGRNIPDVEVSDDVYYNGMDGEKLTESMRDFHNLYVKRKLITSVCRKGNTLIDFACGKGGDFPKWNASRLSFVLGIDISKDNIENKINGACARYLNFKRTDKNTPYALFVNGNSSLNIRSGENMNTDKDNKIIKSVFRIGTKNDNLEPAIERQYGVGYHGFNVSSCQFAIHYMFENKSTFYNFMRNVAECTSENGYFIATTYDGKEVFKNLRNKQIGEYVERYINNKKVWSIQKNYDNELFEDNESSLGYKINVYQDSINKSITEYLVNPEFLIKTMEKYGFLLIDRNDCKRFKIDKPTNTFRNLYNEFMSEIDDKLHRRMFKDVEKDYGKAYLMRNEEKDISFLNRYFIFKKISTRDVAQLTEALISGISYEEEKNVLENERIKDTFNDVKNIIDKSEQMNIETDAKGDAKGDDEEEEIIFDAVYEDKKDQPTPNNKSSKKENPSKAKTKTSRKNTESKSTKLTGGEPKTRKNRESSIQTLEEMKNKRKQSDK
jgi:hypothetical protein